MGDFRKKISCGLISRGKNLWQGNTWRKKISFIAYNAEKQFLHRCTSGKKLYQYRRFAWMENILSRTKSPIPPPLPLKSQMVGP